VEEVKINIERHIPSNIATPTVTSDNLQLISDKFIEDDDIDNIENPFEDVDDLTLLFPTDKLSKQEQEDLEHFNLGIHLEHSRPSIENSFQTQDFEGFFDFEYP